MADDGPSEKPICGIAMPFGDIDGYPPGHNSEVLAIIKDCAREAGAEPRLVSEGDETLDIYKRMVWNLRNNDLVVFDVSGRNPNVAHELGIRLETGKPFILIIDDRSIIYYDIACFEHLKYPSSLRHGDIEKFKAALCKKIKAALGISKRSGVKKTFGELHSLPIEADLDPTAETIDDLKARMDAIEKSVARWLMESLAKKMDPLVSDRDSSRFFNAWLPPLYHLTPEQKYDILIQLMDDRNDES